MVEETCYAQFKIWCTHIAFGSFGSEIFHAGKMFFCLTLLKPNSRPPTKTNKISFLIFSSYLIQPPIRLPNYAQLPYHVQYCLMSSPSLSLSRNQLLYMSFSFLFLSFSFYVVLFHRFLKCCEVVSWPTDWVVVLASSKSISYFLALYSSIPHCLYATIHFSRMIKIVFFTTWVHSEAFTEVWKSSSSYGSWTALSSSLIFQFFLCTGVSSSTLWNVIGDLHFTLQLKSFSVPQLVAQLFLLRITSDSSTDALASEQ